MVLGERHGAFQAKCLPLRCMSAIHHSADETFSHSKERIILLSTLLSMYSLISPKDSGRHRPCDILQDPTSSVMGAIYANAFLMNATNSFTSGALIMLK